MTRDQRTSALVRLERIKKELSFLSQHKPQSLNELVGNDMKLHAIERSLEVLLEAVIDTGRLVIAIKQLPRATTNTEVFDILGKNNIISKPLVESIRGIGGMRNVLIHDYIDIDYEKIYNVLNRLTEIQQFAEEITASLESEE